MAARKKKAAKKSSKVASTSAKYATADGHGYLTKRMTLSRARMAGRLAAINAMRVMGYVVVARGNQVVKVYQDGHTEILGAIN
jgi:hypothetical protein